MISRKLKSLSVFGLLLEEPPLTVKKIFIKNTGMTTKNKKPNTTDIRTDSLAKIIKKENLAINIAVPGSPTMVNVEKTKNL